MVHARLPELTPAQSRLLQAVHEYWRRERRFPRTVTLVVSLRKELDVREVVGTMPSGVILRAGAGSGSDAEVLKLTILGLALCPGEQRIVDAFLALVRNAARQAISNSGSKPVVTRSMLRSLLQDLPQEEFDLVDPVVKDSLHWGGTETDREWARDRWLDVVRFENVQTMAEYLEQEAVDPREVAVLRPEHIELLRAVYTRWSTDGVWPSSREFVIGYRSRGDALRLLAEIPTRYLRRAEWRSLEGKPIVLTLDGIAFTEGADAEMAAFIQMTRVLVGQLEASPEGAHITIQELALNAKVPEPVARRVSEVMADEWALGLNLEETGGTTSVRIGDAILTYEGVQSFTEYLSRREERVRRSPLTEQNELNDSEIRKGILRLFAELPEDGSRHLNRTNVLGRPTQPGGLEYFLNRTFTVEERGRASRIIRQLESDGFLVPTMRDIVAPAEWLMITSAGREVLQTGAELGGATAAEPQFDAFLCHASEDKAAVVAPFAALMNRSGLQPWWDAGQITWGDSLVQKIELGLTRSRYVIVFVSGAFLNKPWPEKELRAALNLEIGGAKKVLPVVLGIAHDALAKSHPFIAEKLYLPIQPYDPSREIAAEDLQRLVVALKEVLGQ